MKITDKWIKNKRPCEEALKWWDKTERNSTTILKNLIKEEHYDWANWFIVRLMTHDKKIRYAIYAAEQVIDIFEKKYPDNDRPRKAIQAAKNYLKDKTVKNKNDAAAASAYAASAYDDAASAAAAAYDAAAAAYAYAAAAAAYAAAAYAAAAAAYAASAYDAAYAASAYAAAAAASAYDDAASSAKKEMQLNILNYGMKLLNTKGKL